MTVAPCTCGEPHPHRVASRRSASGTIVELWSDGPITGALGIGLRGVPISRPKTTRAGERNLRAGWLFLGEVELFEDGELRGLYAACRWAAERDGLPATVRTRLADLAKPSLRPTWHVLHVDRDGRPTCRFWVLPRLGWPDLAIWHERGRYDLMRRMKAVRLPGAGVVSDSTYEPTGFSWGSLREAIAHLIETNAMKGERNQ